MENQRTLNAKVEIEGVGLHSGKKTKIVLNPASEDHGIVFLRKDVESAKPIKLGRADIINFEKSQRMTCLELDGVQIFVTEHLLSSLYGMGIDNVLIEVFGEEIPGLDGSSVGFVQEIEKVGIKEQPKPKEYFSLDQTVCVKDGDSMLVASPCDEFKVSYLLDLDSHGLAKQYKDFTISDNIYKTEIAPARTFCFEPESEKLLKLGFGKGANHDNTLIINSKGEPLKNKLRFPDELVRHKIGDIVGDISVLGKPIKASVMGIKSGHKLNMQLVKKLVELAKQNNEYTSNKKYFFDEIRDILSGVKPGKVLENIQIQNILPHRSPFLLVDRLVVLEEDKHAVGIKNVTFNENFFTGHFPSRPIMPGVLILEAMAQTAGILILHKQENSGKIAYFMSIDNVKFRKTILPGDQVMMDIVVLKLRSKFGQVQTNAYVNDQLVCEAEMKFGLVE